MMVGLVDGCNISLKKFSSNYNDVGTKRLLARLSGTTGNCSPSGIDFAQLIKSSKCFGVFSLPSQQILTLF